MIVEVAQKPDEPSPVTTIKGETGDYVGLAFATTAPRLIGWKSDGVVKVWDSHSGELVRAMTKCHESVATAAISSDGRRVVTVGADGSIRLWDVTPMPTSTDNAVLEKARIAREGKTIRKNGTAIESAAWNFDGTLLAFGAIDGTLSLYDATANAWTNPPEQRLSQRIGHTLFRRDGRLFWSSSVLDGFLKSWQPASGPGAAAAEYPERQNAWSMLGQVGAFDISRDGQWLVTLGRDRQSVVVFRNPPVPPAAAAAR